MSIQKRVIKEKGVCKVFFKYNSSLADDGTKVSIVGDFNDWNPKKNQMKRTKIGHFASTLQIPLDNVYQFRYLINNDRWEADKEADGLIEPYTKTINSLIIV